MAKHDVIIIGAGLAGLIAACYLTDNGKSDVAIVTAGYGGTPYVAAYNAVLPDNPYGDTAKQYCEDMLSAGYQLGNRPLVEELGQLTAQCVEILERWGVKFAKKSDGSYLLRHASGSTYPRSLCRTDMLVGDHITNTLVKALKDKGVTFYENTCCVSLLTRDGGICGMKGIADSGETVTLGAGTVLAAWGGVGHLYKESTYPEDIDGRNPAIAYEAGAALVDLEFVEFEPMICLEPPGAIGEPCPTAMLGEGAYLLNSEGERFLLKVRPEGEAGAGKSLINKAIWEEVKAGRGGPLGGVWVDLRHIDLEVLKAYPWFYERVLNSGLDMKTSLLQVGPMAHSHSGGIEINNKGMSNIQGLFAAGEAAGGMHGACRMAGNAAAQAAVSGLAAAMGILEWLGPETSSPLKRGEQLECGSLQGYSKEANCAALPGSAATRDAADDLSSDAVRTDLGIRAEYSFKIKEAVSKFINRERNAEGLREALTLLEGYKSKSQGDTFTWQLAVSGILLAQAALAREESRGTHIRTDYPEQSDTFHHSIRLKKVGEKLVMEQVVRR